MKGHTKSSTWWVTPVKFHRFCSNLVPRFLIPCPIISQPAKTFSFFKGLSLAENWKYPVQANPRINLHRPIFFVSLPAICDILAYSDVISSPPEVPYLSTVVCIESTNSQAGAIILACWKMIGHGIRNLGTKFEQNRWNFTGVAHHVEDFVPRANERPYKIFTMMGDTSFSFTAFAQIWSRGFLYHAQSSPNRQEW